MKILNALIGLQEGVIDENTTFTCNAGHYYARNAFMACHNKFGTISNLRKVFITHVIHILPKLTK